MSTPGLRDWTRRWLTDRLVKRAHEKRKPQLYYNKSTSNLGRLVTQKQQDSRAHCEGSESWIRQPFRYLWFHKSQNILISNAARRAAWACGYHLKSASSFLCNSINQHCGEWMRIWSCRAFFAVKMTRQSSVSGNSGAATKSLGLL